MPETAGRLVTQTQWENYAESSKKAHPPLGLSTQSFLLYHLRFVVEADICASWDIFGGLGAQISHLSAAHNLAAIETVGLSLAYRDILSLRFTENDRHRSTTEAECASFLSAEQFGVREQAKCDDSNAKHPPAKKTPPAEKPARRQPYKQASTKERLPARSLSRQPKRPPPRNRSITPPCREADPLAGDKRANQLDPRGPPFHLISNFPLKENALD